MAADIQLDYESLPALMPAYLRAATTFSGGLEENATIPNIRVRATRLEVRAEALVRYRKVCGFARAKTLPITYPHVLAFPLQMTVMTHRAFPLKLLGTIHLRNEIIQHRPIAVDETLTIEAAVNGHRDTGRGIEFDLTTRAWAATGACVWEEIGTMLSRRAAAGNRAENKVREAPALDFTPAHETAWSIPADIGRRYASAAGDYNPIHLHRWSAKLFGFPRAIATGMWTKARAAAEIEPHSKDGARRLTVAFKKPVLLPARARFVYATHPAGTDFALIDAAGDRIHLLGDAHDL